ncbi:MAG: LysM peptidoglycan-binding domain-containing protein [Mediterranea massiliensis]|nr:LysM peptidoglycan-binding domain-containing protein [Mediterranea massiliensis]
MKLFKRIFSTLLLTAVGFAHITAQENQSYILHTVEKGQSLYSISSMYGVTQEEIVKLNPGSNEKIYIGRTLRIPRNEANTQEETYHTIQAGETLYGLGVKYNITAQELIKANPGLSANNFRIGQVVRIPKVEEMPSAATATTPETDAISTEIQAPVVPKCREMHKVKRKETVYSISREYGITQEELIAANPELEGKNKIKRGTFLCIPYTQEKKEEIIIANTPTDTELLQEADKNERKIGSSIKAAIILPFLDGVPTSDVQRMVEYYEGFLIAVDSLKQNGTSIDLYTYNSGPESASINGILAKNELKEMDIIFGPLYQSHLKPLAEFAQKNRIRLVVPFKKDETVFQNPSIYQINTSQSYLYSEVYDHFVRQFPNAHVIFINASDEGTKDKEEFIKGLKDELNTRSIPMTTVSDTATTYTLKHKLSKERINVIIPTSGSNITLIKILPHLKLLVRENPEAQINLFGYPEWQTYTKDHLDSFFELDTYFYSSFYTNNLLPTAISFTNSYRRWYGKEMAERYPKFGMLGFDTAFFFIGGLARYGNNLEEKVSEINIRPIQTGFKFQRVNNWGGFINKKVFFVRFTKQYELIKLDFD